MAAGVEKNAIRLVLSAGALVVALSVFGFVVVEVLLALQGVEAQTQSLAQKRLEANETARAAALASETAPERQALTELAVSADGGDVALISQIEALATTSRATAQVTAVGGQGPVGAAPGQVALTIQFSGTYAACLRYLKLIETLPYASHIQTFTLQHDATDESGTTWTGQVTLYALSFDTPS